MNKSEIDKSPAATGKRREAVASALASNAFEGQFFGKVEMDIVHRCFRVHQKNRWHVTAAQKFDCLCLPKRPIYEGEFPQFRRSPGPSLRAE